MVTESYFSCHTRTWSTHHFSWQDTWAIFRLWGGSLFLKLWQHFPLKKSTWNHSHIQYPLGIRRLKSAWSLLIRTERSGVPHWRWYSRLKNMAIHLEPSFQVKFPIQSWETVLMYWFITVSVRLRTQQQQQHTLLTFPKGAFQRQCYKNNPITIKKILFTIKDVLKSECSKRKIKAYKYIKLQLFE